ncbi:hypothetical protein EP331_00165 [bacterium]|nr:MAG: hypothetical protein EP331_00165 [bacterium]
MKENRLQILQKVANGELTTEQADEQLLGLSIVGNSWLSPIDSEREWQEKHLLKIWDNYPNASPLWQYMNGLIRFTCERLQIEVESP